MTDHSFDRSRFATVMRGYDRSEVDTVLADYERWAGEAQARMAQTEEKLRAAGRRADDLEARVSELEVRADEPPRPSVQSLHDRGDKLLAVAREAARDLEAQVEREAVEEREETSRLAAELMRTAHTRVTEIASRARRQRDEAAPSGQDARREADRYIEEGRAEAEARARAIWEKAQGPIHQVNEELERLEQQRLEALDELARLQGSLEDLVRVS